MSDNLGKNESCISCWIRENPSHCWQKQTHIRIYILSRHAHPERLAVSVAAWTHFISEMGNITRNRKWGESKGRSHHGQRAFLLHSEETQNCKNKRLREEEENKNVPLSDLNPIWQNIQTSIWPLWLTDCCFWNLMTAAADSSYSLPMIHFWQNISVIKIITDCNRLLSVERRKKVSQKDDYTACSVVVFVIRVSGGGSTLI